MKEGVYWRVVEGSEPVLCLVGPDRGSETEVRTMGTLYYFRSWNRTLKKAGFVPVPGPDELIRMRNRLSERKTVHEWLNSQGIPDAEGTGKPMCLLRRLAVALGIAPHLPADGGSTPEVET